MSLDSHAIFQPVFFFMYNILLYLVLIYMNQEYEKITKKDSCYPDIWTYLGCCYFMLGMYTEAEKSAEMGKENSIFK